MIESFRTRIIRGHAIKISSGLILTTKIKSLAKIATRWCHKLDKNLTRNPFPLLSLSFSHWFEPVPPRHKKAAAAMIKSASGLAIGTGIESVSSFVIGAGKKCRHNDRIHLQLRIGTGTGFASSLTIRARASSHDRSCPSRRREISRCNLSSDLFRFGLLHPHATMAKEIRSPPWLRCDDASPACILLRQWQLLGVWRWRQFANGWM